MHVKRWFARLAVASLTMGGIATAVASPSSATEPLPPCEPGYEFYLEPCDGGDGWTYTPPTEQPNGSPLGCGVTMYLRITDAGGDNPDHYYEQYFYKNCSPTERVCVSWFNPYPGIEAVWYAHFYPGQGGRLGGNAYQGDLEIHDTIAPASIFTRTLAPGQACGVGLGVPGVFAGAGPGGTDPTPVPDPSGTTDPCDGANARCNTDGDQPPHVTVFGQVTAPVNLGGSENRPLAGARYELWYFGRDGAGTPQQWRPVRDRVDADGRPTGEPVRGYLNADGSYRLDFVYPQTYQLRGGTATWEGCPTGQFSPPFLRSSACSDGDLQLRIHPRNSSGSVVVTDALVPAGTPLVAHAVPLGRFHERPAGGQVSNATSEHALTYRAILTTLSAWPGLSSYPRVEASVDDQFGAEHTHGTNRFRINRSLTGTSVPEHETAHVLARHVYGGEPAGTGCKPHKFTEPCLDTPGSPPNLVSGWWEGLANFVAMVGEHPTYASSTYLPDTYATIDIELCIDSSPTWTLNCQAGEGVEGNVMALLWDLVDSSVDVNATRGLADRYSAPLLDVLQVIRQTKPTTVDAFWQAWWNAHFDDNGVAELRFLNQLGIRDFKESDDTLGTGSWASDGTCGTCAGGDYIYTTGDGEHSYAWNLNGAVNQDGRYDIWVRLPHGQADADPTATYRIATVDGVQEVFVDQRNATDGWVNLSPLGFELEFLTDNQLVLANGPQAAGSVLVADAVIVTRHL